MAKTNKKPASGGNGKKDDFAQWLAKLIEDAHERTERVIQEASERTEQIIKEVIQEEGAANRALMDTINRRFNETLVGFQQQSERHHRENVEQLHRMDETLLKMDENAQEHNRRLEAILDRLVKPGEN